MSKLQRPLRRAATTRGPRNGLAPQRILYRVVTGAAQVLAIRVAGAGLTYASMIFLARSLGAFSFGIYAYVFVMVGLLGLALSFGFNSSSLRFVPDYLARKKWQRLIGFLQQSYLIVLSLSSIGALLGAGLIFLFRSLIDPHYFAPLLVGLACVPLWTLLAQFESTARAFGWMRTAYNPGYILRPLSLMGFVGGLYLLGGHPNAVNALWAMICACAIAAFIQGLLVYRGIRGRVPRVNAAFHPGHWCGVSLGFLVIDGFRMLLDNCDVLVIGRLLDPHSVAVYYATIRTGGLVAFVSFAMIALAVPKFAEIHVTGTKQELQKFVSNVIQLMFWPSLATAGALLLFGRWILSLFGTGFDVGYPTLLVVLAGLVLRSATGPVEYLLNVTGHHRDTILVYGFAAVANLGLNFLLIPTFGIRGAAMATYIAMLSANLVLYLLVQKRLGVNAFVFPLSPKARALPSGVVLASS